VRLTIDIPIVVGAIHFLFACLRLKGLQSHDLLGMLRIVCGVLQLCCGRGSAHTGLRGGPHVPFYRLLRESGSALLPKLPLTRHGIHHLDMHETTASQYSKWGAIQRSITEPTSTAARSLSQAPIASWATSQSLLIAPQPRHVQDELNWTLIDAVTKANNARISFHTVRTCRQITTRYSK
jgi:hypothetical protein